MALTGIFRGVVGETNTFKTARFFDDKFKIWVNCENKILFEILRDVSPYYYTYSLTNSASGSFFAGMPERVREVEALKRLGLTWKQIINQFF